MSTHVKVTVTQHCQRTVELELTPEQVEAFTSGSEQVEAIVFDKLNEAEFEPSTDGLVWEVAP